MELLRGDFGRLLIIRCATITHVSSEPSVSFCDIRWHLKIPGGESTSVIRTIPLKVVFVIIMTIVMTVVVIVMTIVMTIVVQDLAISYCTLKI